MLILGLETSCDETAAAVLKNDRDRFLVLSDIVSSQVKLHSKFGGVVPNLAAREHLKNILPIIEKSLEEARVKPEDIDLISVTRGPGLIPALLIGTETAKTLSYLWKKPLLGIHHIEGHIYANFTDSFCPTLSFPILCIVVSGGHTQLILMKNHLNYKIIGQTLDDAAGEAFDKVARILNLGYPGGPIISQCADEFRKNIPDIKCQISDIKFPRPMLNSDNFNFSFSGLKTAVLYLVKKNEKLLNDKNFVNAVSYEFQQAAIDVLIGKTLKAAKKYSVKTVLLAGGVSANCELRKQLGSAIRNKLPKIKYKIPDIKYCGDNAVMIATAGFYRYEKNKESKKFQKEISNNWKNLEADADLKLN
jgi:N6-L-threonylcarbamoyladenine synthase